MIFVGGEVLKGHIFLFIFLPLCVLLYSWAIGKTVLWIYTFSFNLSSSSVSIVVTRRTCKTHWWRKIKKTLLKPRKRSTKKRTFTSSTLQRGTTKAPVLSSCALLILYTVRLRNPGTPLSSHSQAPQTNWSAPMALKDAIKHVVI